MNPADLTLAIVSPSFTSKTLPTPQSSALKNGKVPVPRVDLEPIYTQLKAALGDQWADYKAAINAFVLGKSVLYVNVHQRPAYGEQGNSTKRSCHGCSSLCSHRRLQS